MPAVTADTVALPRLPSPALEAVERPVASVTTAPGFETVTYMTDGVFRHQDSNGGGGLITDGDTQWMTAGAGLPFA
jgi:quercetin 2,3-dioxygenase